MDLTKDSTDRRSIFPFFALPREIRDEIYCCLWSKTRLVYDTHGINITVGEKPNEYYASPKWIYINKAFFEECRATFLENAELLIARNFSIQAPHNFPLQGELFDKKGLCGWLAQSLPKLKKWTIYSTTVACNRKPIQTVPTHENHSISAEFELPMLLGDDYFIHNQLLEVFQQGQLAVKDITINLTLQKRLQVTKFGLPSRQSLEENYDITVLDRLPTNLDRLFIGVNASDVMRDPTLISCASWLYDICKEVASKHVGAAGSPEGDCEMTTWRRYGDKHLKCAYRATSSRFRRRLYHKRLYR